jgi:hypothetical protein
MRWPITRAHTATHARRTHTSTHTRRTRLPLRELAAAAAAGSRPPSVPRPPAARRPPLRVCPTRDVVLRHLTGRTAAPPPAGAPTFPARPLRERPWPSPARRPPLAEVIGGDPERHLRRWGTPRSRTPSPKVRNRALADPAPPQRRVLQAYDYAATLAGAELVRPSHPVASRSTHLELIQNTSAPIRRWGPTAISQIC